VQRRGDPGVAAVVEHVTVFVAEQFDIGGDGGERGGQVGAGDGGEVFEIGVGALQVSDGSGQLRALPLGPLGQFGVPSGLTAALEQPDHDLGEVL
jgi:hypothetical protein